MTAPITLTIAVASDNPVKIAVAAAAFSKVFPDKAILPLCVKSVSGVPEQPMGLEETLRGAKNRLAFVKERFPEADYWIAQEGGSYQPDWTHHLCETAYIVAEGKHGGRGIGRTATFPIPTAIAEAVLAGDELGPATDRIFGTTNVKHGVGLIGILTDGHLDRVNLYIPAALVALAQIVHHEWYRARDEG